MKGGVIDHCPGAVQIQLPLSPRASVLPVCPTCRAVPDRLHIMFALPFSLQESLNNHCDHAEREIIEAYTVS
jgi:hypothetical protein